MSYLASYGMFLKRFSIFKKQDVYEKIIDLREFNRIPYNSVFHFFDNFDNDIISDIPRLEYYPFLQSNNFGLTYIFHNQHIPVNIPNSSFGLNNYRIKFISKELYRNKAIFTSKTRSQLKPISSPSDLSKFEDKERILLIINHNPLFRAKLIGGGQLKSYYYFDVVLSSIFYFLTTNFKEKHKFLFIPLHNKRLFTKGDFIRIFNQQKISISTLSYNSFLYYFYIHLLFYLYSEEPSPFSYFFKLNDIVRNNLNLVFFNEEHKGVVLNLNHIKSLVGNNKQYVWKILAFLNSLAIQEYENIEEIEKKTESEEIQSGILPTSNNDTKEILDNQNRSSLNPEKDIQSQPSVDEEPPVEYEKPKEYIKEIQESIEEFLESQDNLTPKQKEYFKKLSQSYKNIKVGNKTIDEIINTPPKLELEEKNVENKLTPLQDKSYAKTKVLDLNKQYMDNVFYHDMFKSILAFQKIGLFLTDYKEEDEFNELSLTKHITFTFVDIKGKKSTVKLKIPVLDSDGYFRSNGVKSYMKYQLINLPICKLDFYRVSLASNYNKTLVERNLSPRFSFSNNLLNSILKYNKDNPKDQIEIERHMINFKDIKLPYEYSSIGKKIRTIKSKDYLFFFDYKQRGTQFNIDEQMLNQYESKYGVLCGKYLKNENTFYFFNDKNEVLMVDLDRDQVVEKKQLMEFLLPLDYLNTPHEFCYLKILDKNLPIIFVLCYKYGLLKILDRLKVRYRVVESGKRLNLQPNECYIKFKDKTLIYNRYPLLKSWILNGFLYFNNIKNYTMDELEIQDTYYNLLQDKGISINYLKGIDNFYNFFIDPITRDVLEQMGEPTNPRDLLIRAVELLTTEDYKDPASIENFRLRSLEKINGIIYNEIARQYAQRLNDKTKDVTFSINTESIYQRILQDQACVLAEETNPIHYLKERTGVTHAGFLGRTSESFVEKDRKYPDDAVGILSEATPDSSKVALNAFLSFNPSIKNMRGFFEKKDLKDLEPGNILSVTASLMPFASNDDPKRANFINIQLSHHIPCNEGRPSRVRTGMEAIIGDFVGSTYAIIAKDDGQVIKVNPKTNMFRVRYKDGTEDIFQYGSKHGEVSGHIIEHDIELLVSENKKFKKGDVLAYNKGFFKYDYIFNQLNWKHGVIAKIGILEKDITLEDSSAFTKEFSQKMTFKSVYTRVIRISNDLTITDYAKIGDKTNYDTPLIQLEYKDIANLDLEHVDDEFEESKDLLLDLQLIVTKAKHSGVISNIKVLYSGDLNDFDPSVQNFIKWYNKMVIERYKDAKGTIKEHEFVPALQVEPGTRIKKLEINENELLVIYYITEEVGTTVGDKLVIDNSLKTVQGQVLDEISTKQGIKLDGIFSGSSIFNRILTSPIKQGILEQVLGKIEEEAIKMYFEK